MGDTRGDLLHVARVSERVTRDLLVGALLAEHHARAHWDVARLGMASVTASFLAAAAVFPPLLLVALALALAVGVRIVGMRRTDAAIRAAHGNRPIPRPRRTRGPGPRAIATAVTARAAAELAHSSALDHLIALEDRTP